MPDTDSAPKVLVVEDDSLLLRMLASALGEEGLAVSTAGRADKGLAMLQACAGIELVITDINMPGMSGLELLDRAQALRPNIRRMVISGRPDLCADLLPPATEFLPKPFTARQFVARVRGILADGAGPLGLAVPADRG